MQASNRQMVLPIFAPFIEINRLINMMGYCCCHCLSYFVCGMFGCACMCVCLRMHACECVCVCVCVCMYTCVCNCTSVVGDWVWSVWVLMVFRLVLLWTVDALQDPKWPCTLPHPESQTGPLPSCQQRTHDKQLTLLTTRTQYRNCSLDDI